MDRKTFDDTLTALIRSGAVVAVIDRHELRLYPADAVPADVEPLTVCEAMTLLAETNFGEFQKSPQNLLTT